MNRRIASIVMGGLWLTASLPAAEEHTMKQKRQTSVLLKEVPWVGFYQGPKKGNPEDHPLPSCMRALMEYAEDDLGLPKFRGQRGKWRWPAVALFHGVTGSGFGFSWHHPYGEAHVGRELIRTYERAFEAAGYDVRMLLRPTFAARFDYDGPVSDDGDKYRREIVASIRDRSVPVMAIGVIGPEEPCLICGFRDDGKTIVGWNFFPDEARKDPRVSFDEEGRFVMRDWFRDTHGIVLPGGKALNPPSRRDVCIRALRRDVALLCNRGSEGKPLGAAAYQAWIEYLLAPVPADVAGDPRQIEPLYKKHNDPIGELAERRAYAGTFLGQAADAVPVAAGALHHARYCHQAIHDLLWRVWQTLGAWNRTDDAKLLRFAERDFRIELASLVRRLQAWDTECAEHIRNALVQAGVPDADLPRVPRLPPVEGVRDLWVETPFPTQLGGMWEGGSMVISGVPAPAGADLGFALRAASAVTPWPVDAESAGGAGLNALAASAGWQLRVVNVPSDESMLDRARRINDVVLSCLYGLPVATTHNGNPIVVVGYNHLAGETLRVRLPGQKADQPPSGIRMNDKGWGRTWVFLHGRLPTD